MKPATFEKLLLISLFFLAHWFFGNLYEEIVLAPNQIVNTHERLQCWQNYFTVTNQIYYYVPFTQISVIIVCCLFWTCKDQTVKSLLKKASIFGLLSIVVTVIIITQLNVKLFFGNLEQYRDQLFAMSIIWMIANALRIYLVGSALFYTFRSYVLSSRW